MLGAATVAEWMEQDPSGNIQFFRFANAPSALYPSPSEEKRLLDVMLLAVPR